MKILTLNSYLMEDYDRLQLNEFMAEFDKLIKKYENICFEKVAKETIKR